MHSHIARMVGIAAACTCMCMGGVCSAQETKQNGAAAPLPFASPLGEFSVTPSSPQKDVFDIRASMAPMAPLLQSIAQQANLKMIISDDVQALRILNVRLTGVTAEKAIQAISSTCNLAWGKVGPDTYLIVRGAAPVVVRVERVVPTPTNPLPRQNDRVNPEWKPFTFNGAPYYVVPLRKGEAERSE